MKRGERVKWCKQGVLDRGRGRERERDREKKAAGREGLGNKKMKGETER